MGRKVTKIAAVVAALFAGGVKIAVHLGVGAGVGMAEVAASKNDPWNSDFKNAYVEGCVESFRESGIESHQKSIICGCLSDGTEAAHVLPTKYLATRSEEAVAKEFQEIVGTYSNSPEGQQLTSKCIAAAGLELNPNRATASVPAEEIHEE